MRRCRPIANSSSRYPRPELTIDLELETQPNNIQHNDALGQERLDPLFKLMDTVYVVQTVSREIPNKVNTSLVVQGRDNKGLHAEHSIGRV